MKKVLENEILFARQNSDVIIPTKREEDGAFDIYAYFEENYIIIPPHETKMIPTGLASAFSDKYVAILKERGSTGSKGIGQRCGVVDSGYRGEWFVPLTNHNDVSVIILKNSNYYDTQKFCNADSVLETVLSIGEDNIAFAGDIIVYPYEKAICQCIMVEVPKLHTREVTMDELVSYESERGFGALGSSKK